MAKCMAECTHSGVANNLQPLIFSLPSCQYVFSRSHALISCVTVQQAVFSGKEKKRKEQKESMMTLSLHLKHTHMDMQTHSHTQGSSHTQFDLLFANSPARVCGDCTTGDPTVSCCDGDGQSHQPLGALVPGLETLWSMGNH